MSALFGQMMITDAGEAAFRHGAFNDAIRCDPRGMVRLSRQLQQPQRPERGAAGLAVAARPMRTTSSTSSSIPDRSAPHWGWPSFNAFFHREIRPEARPIAAPDDPKVIVSANDGTVYKIEREVLERGAILAQGPALLAGQHAGRQRLCRPLHRRRRVPDLPQRRRLPSLARARSTASCARPWSSTA